MKTFNLRGLLILFLLIFMGCQDDYERGPVLVPESWDLNGKYDGHLAIFYRDDSELQEDVTFNIKKENDYIHLTSLDSKSLDSKNIKISTLTFRIREIDRTISDNGYIYFETVDNQSFKSLDKYGVYTNRFSVVIDPTVSFAPEPRISMRLKLISLTNDDIGSISIEGTKYL